MSRWVALRFATAALLSLLSGVVRAQRPNVLTEEEEQKVREAQDPSERIELYLTLAQARLDRFEEARKKTPEAQAEEGPSPDSLLSDYIVLTDEWKDWIDYQYQRGGDMRRGLRAVLDRGPRQLEQLRRLGSAPDASRADYRDTLLAAVDDLSDALDGATRALGEQQKKFLDEKREEKAAAQAAKQRRKDEEKRAKEEKKLRKREDRKKAPGERDED